MAKALNPGSRHILQIPGWNLAICRFPPGTELPEWIREDRFVSITRTPEELSVVCPEELLPDGIQAERGWQLIKLKGPIEFSMTGVLASLVRPLSEANIPLFAISTYDTDYLLVKNAYMSQAVKILKRTCIIEQLA